LKIQIADCPICFSLSFDLEVSQNPKDDKLKHIGQSAI